MKLNQIAPSCVVARDGSVANSPPHLFFCHFAASGFALSALRSLRLCAGLFRFRLRLLAALLMIAASAFAADDSQRTGGPYVPTPQVVVDAMLRMANVGASDFVIDLGSGDGVIVLTAATQFKARGFGVDIDPELVKLSNDTAKKRGVADRARFLQQDVFKADLGQATVLTLYLLPAMMIDLRSKIFNELSPGARVVSHDYHFGGEWLADDELTFDVPEKEMVTGVPTATVRLWVVPAKIAGTWSLKLPAGSGSDSYELTLRQYYKTVEGTAAMGGGRPARLTQAALRGEEFSFAFPVEGKAQAARFTAKVRGDAMEGVAELPDKRTVRFTGVRTAAGMVTTN